MGLELRKEVWAGEKDVKILSIQTVLKPNFLLSTLRSQATLTHVLQTQDQLWANLSNPSVAMRELAGETPPVPHVVTSPQENPEGSGLGER